MLLEGDGIQIARNRVAFDFRMLKRFSANSFFRQPAHPFFARLATHRSARQFLANRINQPQPGLLSKLRAKPKAILSALFTRRFIGSPRKSQFRLRSGPFLIIQFGSGKSDGIVEPCQKAVRILQLINRGTLMSDQPVIVHQEFVLFGLAAKDGMIFQNEASFSASRLALEE